MRIYLLLSDVKACCMAVFLQAIRLRQTVRHKDSAYARFLLTGSVVEAAAIHVALLSSLAIVSCLLYSDWTRLGLVMTKTISFVFWHVSVPYHTVMRLCIWQLRRCFFWLGPSTTILSFYRNTHHVIFVQLWRFLYLFIGRSTPNVISTFWKYIYQMLRILYFYQPRCELSSTCHALRVNAAAYGPTQYCHWMVLASCGEKAADSTLGDRSVIFL